MGPHMVILLYLHPHFPNLPATATAIPGIRIAASQFLRHHRTGIVMATVTGVQVHIYASTLSHSHPSIRRIRIQAALMKITLTTTTTRRALTVVRKLMRNLDCSVQ